MIRSHLDRANRYIAELRADIARERVVIEHALDAGYPSAVAESMLHALEGALRIFEKHRGIARVAADFLLNLIAYNLIRIPKLLAA